MGRDGLPRFDGNFAPTYVVQTPYLDGETLQSWVSSSDLRDAGTCQNLAPTQVYVGRPSIIITIAQLTSAGRGLLIHLP